MENCLQKKIKQHSLTTGLTNHCPKLIAFNSGQHEQYLKVPGRLMPHEHKTNRALIWVNGKDLTVWSAAAFSDFLGGCFPKCAWPQC